MASQKINKICKHGHIFYKSSNCITCPTCEKLKDSVDGFLAPLSSPARNTLLYHGIDTIEKLSQFTEKDILKLHGIGKTSLPIFKKILNDEGLKFKEIEKTNQSENRMNEIDTYIQQFPEDVQLILNTIRKIIKDNVANVEESISYGMPSYKFNKKPLVYFAAYKNHIGFYATPSGHKEFIDELSKYKQGKGSVQFPLNQPIPYALIEKIVRFRMMENSSTIEK